MRMIRIAAVVACAILPALAGAASEKFRPLAQPSTGFGRYRVTLSLYPGDDLGTVSRQPAATYRGRIEPFAEEEFVGFVVATTETAARMLSADPRVALVEELAPVYERAVAEAAPVAHHPEPPAPVASPPLPRPAEIAPQATGSSWSTGTYTYDGSGNVKSIGTDTFVYDSFGRLTSGAAGTGRKQEYTYDALGNLLTITTDGATVNQRKLGVDPATNQITRTTDPVTGAPYNVYGTYDKRGNMTSNAVGDTFRYDGLGRLAESTVGGVRKVYLYGPDDERIAAITVSPQWSADWTLRDTGGRVLRRYAQSGNGDWSWTQDYIYRDGQLLASAVNAPEKVRHFHRDHLGTPRLITGGGGAELSRHTYYPFGEEVPSASQSSERMKFTGHERDAVNLDYMHARYYTPVWGRFLSVDPILGHPAEPQSWNRYSYVSNNPLNFTDPTGMCGEPADLIGPTLPCDIDFAEEIEVTAEAPGIIENIEFIADETTAQITPFGPVPGSAEGNAREALNKSADRDAVENVVLIDTSSTLTRWRREWRNSRRLRVWRGRTRGSRRGASGSWLRWTRSSPGRSCSS